MFSFDCKIKLIHAIGSSIAQWFSSLLPDPAAPGSIPSAPEIFSDEKIVTIAVVNQHNCFEESGLWLENVHQTFLVLASVEKVLQKSIFHATLRPRQLH